MLRNVVNVRTKDVNNPTEGLNKGLKYRWIARINTSHKWTRL